MALTKSASTLTWASGSATTSGTTNAVDVSGSYAASLYVSVVVVGTATTAASYKVQVSADSGSTYFDYPSNSSYTAGLTAATYEWTILLPADATGVRVAYTAQSGGTSSTLTGQVGKVTAL